MRLSTISIPLAQRGDDGNVVVAIIQLALVVFILVSLWKVFVKTGRPGWYSIIPIFNMYQLIKIAGKPGWWLILFFIPFVNIVFAIIVSIGVAKAFGKGTGFGVGLALLGFIFYPILGFGSATYQEPQEPRGFEVIPPARA
jgi:apolipoprotein N-acyltransferase